MKELSRKDKIWGWILAIFPSVILGASLIPGIMEVFYWDARFYVRCGLLDMPGGTYMSGIRISLLIGMAFLVIAGILYYKNQSLEALKAILVLGAFCTVLFSIGLVLKGTHLHPLIKPFPYGLLPAGSLVLTVLSVIRFRQERKNEA